MINMQHTTMYKPLHSIHKTGNILQA